MSHFDNITDYKDLEGGQKLKHLKQTFDDPQATSISPYFVEI